MSKTGWTLRQAKDAKESGELMCISLRKIGGTYWQVELHEWDGFRGPLEDDKETPISFPSADLAIRAVTDIGFNCDHFLNSSQPDTNAYLRGAENVRLVVSNNGTVRVAVERSALQLI